MPSLRQRTSAESGSQFKLGQTPRADPTREGLDLAADRVFLGLLIRRDAGIERGPDRDLIHGDVPPEEMRRASRAKIGGRPDDPPPCRDRSPGGPLRSAGDRPSRAIDPANVKVGSYDEFLWQAANDG